MPFFCQPTAPEKRGDRALPCRCPHSTRVNRSAVGGRYGRNGGHGRVLFTTVDRAGPARPITQGWAFGVVMPASRPNSLSSTVFNHPGMGLRCRDACSARCSPRSNSGRRFGANRSTSRRQRMASVASATSASRRSSGSMSGLMIVYAKSATNRNRRPRLAAILSSHLRVVASLCPRSRSESIWPERACRSTRFRSDSATGTAGGCARLALSGSLPPTLVLCPPLIPRRWSRPRRRCSNVGRPLTGASDGALLRARRIFIFKCSPPGDLSLNGQGYRPDSCRVKGRRV